MKPNVDSKSPLISNGFVTCYADYFLIHWYYFPFGRKKVKYNDIRSCDFHSTNDMDIFTFKHWGMALSPIWWHCDIRRLSRKHFLLIDTNQWPKIGLTMNDDDLIHVCNLIRQKMFAKQSISSALVSEKELEHRKSLEQFS